MSIGNLLAQFGNRGGLLSRMEQNRGVQIRNNLAEYSLGAAQRAEQRQNQLGDLYSRYTQGDQAAGQQIAGIDPQFHMAMQQKVAALDEAQRKQLAAENEQFGRMLYMAKDNPQMLQQMGMTPEQANVALMKSAALSESLFKMVNPEQPEAIRTLETLQARPDLMQMDIARKRAGATNTQVNIKQDTKEGEAVGKFYGEEFANLQLGARKARQNNSKLDRLEQMFATATPGRMAPLANSMKAWAQGVGIDLESIGVTDTTPEADSIAAITNQMALALRNPAGGEGMPGALSDKDREFLMASVPGLQKTPGGNQKIIEYMRRMNERSIQEAAMAREYRKRYGSLDETFYDLLDDYAAENPVFPEAQGIVNQNAAPATGNLSDMTTEQLMQMLEGSQ